MGYDVVMGSKTYDLASLAGWKDFKAELDNLEGYSTLKLFAKGKRVKRESLMPELQTFLVRVFEESVLSTASHLLTNIMKSSSRTAYLTDGLVPEEAAGEDNWYVAPDDDLTDNVYCPTGKGGGIDPTCKKGGKFGPKTSIKSKRNIVKSKLAKSTTDKTYGTEPQKVKTKTKAPSDTPKVPAKPSEGSNQPKPQVPREHVVEAVKATTKIGKPSGKVSRTNVVTRDVTVKGKSIATITETLRPTKDGHIKDFTVSWKDGSPSLTFDSLSSAKNEVFKTRVDKIMKKQS